MRKVLLNLHSEQLLPNYLAIVSERPEEVYALVTPQFGEQVSLLNRLTGVPHTAVQIDPYDFNKNITVIQKLLVNLKEPSEIVVNCTGGTKVMAIAAVFGTISSSSEHIRRFIYLDTQKASFEEIEVERNGHISNPEQIPVEVSIPFEIYLKLRGEIVHSACEEPVEQMRIRKNIGMMLTNYMVLGFFSKQSAFMGHNSPNQGTVTFRLNDRGSKKQETATFKWSPLQAELLVRDKQLIVKAPDHLFYFGGGWLEELSYLSLLDSGKFDEVLHNVVIDLPKEAKEKIHHKDPVKNEIDIVVTKGIRAAIIECKAGRVLQTDVYKLSAIRNRLLGPFGIAALVTRFPPDASIVEKAKDNRISIVLIYPVYSFEQRIISLFEDTINVSE